MDDKRRVYDISIRLQHIFLVSPGTCACNVYQAISPPPLEGPGYKATVTATLASNHGDKGVISHRT